MATRAAALSWLVSAIAEEGASSVVLLVLFGEVGMSKIVQTLEDGHEFH